MAAYVLNLNNIIELIPANTLDENDSLREQNPLGKMPCLILDDGTTLFDSRVIVEFLQSLVPETRLIPRAGLERYQALTLSCLCDGIADAALLMTYETRFREVDQVSERWLRHQRGKVERGLTSIEKSLPAPEITSISSISLACALGYLDWRKQVPWRDQYPVLVDWLTVFIAHEPAFDATANPELEIL